MMAEADVTKCLKTTAKRCQTGIYVELGLRNTRTYSEESDYMQMTSLYLQARGGNTSQ